MNAPKLFYLGIGVDNSKCRDPRGCGKAAQFCGSATPSVMETWRRLCPDHARALNPKRYHELMEDRFRELKHRTEAVLKGG